MRISDWSSDVCSSDLLGFAQYAVFDDKDIFARPFGYKAVGIKQNGFIVAVVQGLGVGDDGVGISAGDFGARHRYIHVLTGIRRNFYAYALLQGFFAQISAQDRKSTRLNSSH